MTKFLDRFNYVYIWLYTLIFYYFFITLVIKENSSRITDLSSTDSNLLQNLNSSYREKKFFIDLKYKKDISSFDTPITNIILIDKEYKIVGSESIEYRKTVCTSFTFYLGRKFLYSSLFGSIKLITL